MADVATIQAGISTRFATVVSRTLDNDRDLVAVPPGGLAVVGLPTGVDYDFTFARGADTYTFVVRVLTGRQSERAAEKLLASVISGTGTSSVKAAFEGNESLGGAADTCRVTTAGSLGSYVYGEVEYLGVEFTIEVIA
jgi:hypothetical protein